MKSRFTPLVNWLLVLLLIAPFLMYSRTLHIGSGYAWTSPNSMQGQVVAGDTVIIHAGSYTGAFFITNLNGTAVAPIIIKAAAGETVLFTGGTESFHFSDIAYVELQGIIAQSQSGNGMNIDDAGTFATPSHHILIKDCTFRSINATGNNDLLKLSGVDDFTVQNCIFLNGAGGGSGVDMVGCHRGLFQSNQFTNLGSNSIQIKGGSQDITIRQCRFTNGGLRGINIGGSTDLEFFRPQNATFEASRVQIHSNIIEGSEAPFAFVGAVDCKVIHNTILRPGKWAMRILQETVDISRFEPCGRNTIQNNIFIITTAVSTEVNIGPDTAPGTFIYSNNLWYKEGQSNWPGPVLPVADPNIILGNPGLNSTTFSIMNSSIAYQKGKTGTGITTDYYSKTYRNPPSIGAVEAESPLALKSEDKNKTKLQELNNSIKLYPNPAGNIIHLDVPERAVYTIVNVQGNKLKTGSLLKGDNVIYIQDIRAGIYFAHLEFQYSKSVLKWIKTD